MVQAVAFGDDPTSPTRSLVKVLREAQAINGVRMEIHRVHAAGVVVNRQGEPIAGARVIAQVS